MQHSIDDKQGQNICLIHDKKSAPKIIFEIFFCLETYKGDHAEEVCEVSSAPVVKLMRPFTS